VLQALLVLALTLFLAQLARRAFLHASVKTNADVNTRYLVARLLYLGVLFLGLATVLAIFEVPLTAVAAFIGVIGLGISLALQDILKNFFAGLYLLFERPFRIGEHIRVKEFEGRVEDIGVRTTNLRTVENAEVLIPNAIVFAEVVSNRTHVRVTPGAASSPAQKAAVVASASSPTGPTGTGTSPTYENLREVLEHQRQPSPPPDVAP
jgi:small-conductance mechanosensitive channel